MKKWFILAGVAVLLIAIGIVVLRPRDPLRSKDRRTWKDRSIAEIAACIGDPAWPTNEFTRLKAQIGGESSGEPRWLSDRIIVTRNGEWLAYASVCRKEAGRIHDLFLARGSDGRWYYSTFHFCIGMMVLGIDEQPEDLARFAKTYFLRTFDGHSDDCLQKTWPRDSR